MKTMKIRVWHLPARRPRTESVLLDSLMPRYEVASHHSLVVRAPAATVYAELARTDLSRVPLAQVLMSLRALPARLRGRPAHPRRPVTGEAAAAPTGPRFVVLAEQPGRERLLGLAGRFWHPTGNLARLADAAAWQAYAVPGTARAAMTLRVEPINYQTARLYTETRVQTQGRRARLLFRAYWTLIGPFSGLLRRSLLRRVKADAEAATGLFLLTP